MTELHFTTRPVCDYPALKKRVEELLDEEIDCSDPESTERAHLIIHQNHAVEYEDGKMPAQTAILMSDEPPNLESYREDIEQSWQCTDAAELLLGSEHTCLVTEMMCRSLTPAVRVALFHAVLQAVVEISSPRAMVFKSTQQVVNPNEYLDACSVPPIQRPGSLNVRLFNITNSSDDRIMDTRGLEEIGLHDLQCHFRDLDPDKVGQLLFNTALYIFENGAVIESGQTVSGIEHDSRWRCHFEDALIEPTRVLLDLDPGPPYSAGNRD